MATVTVSIGRHAVHGLEHALAGVIIGQRRGLGPIGDQTPAQHVRIVVGAQLLAAGGHFRNPRLDALDQDAFVDLQLDHAVELEAALGQQAVERLAPAAPCAGSRRG